MKAFNIFIWSCCVTVYNGILQINGEGLDNDGVASPNNTIVNVIAAKGADLHLVCPLKNYYNDSVAWINSDRNTVLAVNTVTITRNPRVSALRDNSGEYILRIERLTERDAGTYTCMKHSRDNYKMELRSSFEVEVLSQGTRIRGPSENFMESGSTITLHCDIKIDRDPPSYVFWYNGEDLLESSDPRITKTETLQYSVFTSKLVITNAVPADSGTYKCVPTNMEPASTVVHIPYEKSNGASVSYGIFDFFYNLFQSFFVVP